MKKEERKKKKEEADSKGKGDRVEYRQHNG